MELRADAPAASIPPEDRKELRCGDDRPWCFAATLHIPKVNHKVRIVILWKHRRDAEACKLPIRHGRGEGQRVGAAGDETRAA
jgi:hypothetical protein